MVVNMTNLCTLLLLVLYMPINLGVQIQQGDTGTSLVMEGITVHNSLMEKV